MTLTDSFSSARLSYRPVQEVDADAILDLYSNPEVIKGMPGIPLYTALDQARAKVAHLRDVYEETDMGLMAVEVTGAKSPLIGLAGVSALGPKLAKQYPHHLEIGYVLHPLFWGKGLATEAVTTWTQRALAQDGINGLVAAIAPHNAASQAVIKKVGYHFSGTGPHLGHHMRFYTMTKSD